MMTLFCLSWEIMGWLCLVIMEAIVQMKSWLACLRIVKNKYSPASLRYVDFVLNILTMFCVDIPILICIILSLLVEIKKLKEGPNGLEKEHNCNDYSIFLCFDGYNSLLHLMSRSLFYLDYSLVSMGFSWGFTNKYSVNKGSASPS